MASTAPRYPNWHEKASCSAPSGAAITCWKTSVRGYIGRLQAAARGKGGEDAQEARARFAAAQTALTEAKARQLSGELVEASEVEVFWKGKLRAFRNRVLSVPARVRDLNARQNVVLTQELRACLNELADDKAG